MLQEKVATATGGMALLSLSGFEPVGDYLVMETRDDELVEGIINTIEKRVNVRSFLRSPVCGTQLKETREWQDSWSLS